MIRSYKKLLLSHEGFYNALYNDLKKEDISINESFKKLLNKGNGIAYELYKIINKNCSDEITMKSYKNIIQSKEGTKYWLAYYSQKITKK